MSYLVKLDTAVHIGGYNGGYSKLHSVGKYSAPFVFNRNGKLIHRPIQFCIYRLLTKKDFFYEACKYHCGNAANGRQKFKFMHVIPDHMAVCPLCETRAIMAGLPSSTDICNKHVHVGKVGLIIPCHPAPGTITTNNTSVAKN